MKINSSLTTNETGADAAAPASRAEGLFRKQREELYRETDQLFVRLLLLEWAVLVIVALLVAPESWRGQTERVDWQLWMAIVFGGAPFLLVRLYGHLNLLSGWGLPLVLLASLSLASALGQGSVSRCHCGVR